MPRLRQSIGPILIATAVWCAAGDITVASDAGASARVAVPAPWWCWLAALLAAAVVPAWRRDWRVAAPALLSTLPWWPVPIPAIALLWTGPLAWAPIGAALIAAVGNRTQPLPESYFRSPSRAPLLAGVLTAIACTLAAWSAAPRVPGGDEPHYLVIAQSLILDGDLRIDNNHERRDYASYYEGTLRPDVLRKGVDGGVYSVHAPGVAILILPAFLAGGYAGAQAMLILIAALTAGVVWRIGWHATNQAGAAWFAWAAVTGSATFTLLSFQVFPDGPGGLAVAVATLVIVKLSRASSAAPARQLVIAGALLAALPWLHTRFAVLAVGFGAAIAWLTWTNARSRSERIGQLAACLLVPMVSAACWFLYFLMLYGTANPAAPYGNDDQSRLAHIPGGLTGLLFDQQFGLLAYAPVLGGAAFAIWSATDRRLRAAAAAVLAIVALYLAAVTTYWFWIAGLPGVPARLATAVLPALSLPLAIAWSRASPAARRVWMAWLLVTVAATATIVGVNRAALAWNLRDGHAQWLEWLAPVVDLTRGAPSFFWRLDPADLTTQLPFAAHAALWALVFVVGSYLTARVARRSTPPAVSRAGVGAGLMCALMLNVQIGWWLNGTNGLDPARSQLAVLVASAGRSALDLRPLRVSSNREVVASMRVRSEAPGVMIPDRSLLTLADVPAGRYQLEVDMARPVAGMVDVVLGHGARQIPLRPLASQSAEVMLPGGARRLVVRSDAAVQNAGAVARLRPLTIAPPIHGFAHNAVIYGAVELWFLGGDVFQEQPGFWVQGGATAAFVVRPTEPGQLVRLLIRNGAHANVVTVDDGERAQRLALEPGEEREVEWPSAARWEFGRRVTIDSANGFRPSDAGTSDDRRYLGVWVQPRLP